jgi:acetate kinase
VKILVLNCGSSSVKYQVFSITNGEQADALAGGIVEEVGLGNPTLKHTKPGMEKLVKRNLPVGDHKDAIKIVIETLCDPTFGVLGSVTELQAVGHRVVHGAEKFSSSVRIDDAVMKALYDNIELAPLHNPPNIQGIEAVSALLPDIPQVGVFDTAFHQTMEPYAYLYAIPYSLYEKHGVRRYGFHGTSHKFVALQAAKYLGKPITELKIITCHLGNGASVTAIKYGKSVDTSMGFTPLEGLAMGTRCGDLDPAIVFLLMKKEKLTVDAVDNLLNKRSGVCGLSSGLSSDMRTFEDAMHKGPSDPNYERSMLVLKLYCHRVQKYIGAYAACMGGVDCVVFTGGIGENFSEVCDWSCQGLEFMGISGVKAKRAGGNIFEASAPDSKVKVLIVPTNEELAIARDTFELTNGQRLVNGLKPGQ